MKVYRSETAPTKQPGWMAVRRGWVLPQLYERGGVWWWVFLSHVPSKIVLLDMEDCWVESTPEAFKESKCYEVVNT